MSGSPRVNVVVQIVPRARQRIVKGVPVLVLNLSGDFDVLPEKVELVLVGEEDALALVAPEKLVVTLDGTSLAEGPARTVPMRVRSQSVYNLPPGVGVDEGGLPRVFIRMHPSAPAPTPGVLDGGKNQPQTPVDEAGDSHGGQPGEDAGAAETRASEDEPKEPGDEPPKEGFRTGIPFLQ